MFRRKLLDRGVDPCPNFLTLHPLMRQGLGLRNCSRSRIDFLPLDGVVELGAAAFDLLFPQPIDSDIGYDPVDPGVKRRLAAKSTDRFPRLEERVLGEVPGVLLVMHHVVNHTENSRPVAGYQLVEGRGITLLATLHQIEFRDIGLSRSRFRMHIWTEKRLIHSTRR